MLGTYLSLMNVTSSSFSTIVISEKGSLHSSFIPLLVEAKILFGKVAVQDCRLKACKALLDAGADPYLQDTRNNR